MSPYLLQVIPTYPNTMPNFQSMSCDRFCTCATLRTDTTHALLVIYTLKSICENNVLIVFCILFQHSTSTFVFTLLKFGFSLFCNIHNFLPSQDKDACLPINMAFPKSKNKFINTCLKLSVETLFRQKLAIHAYESTLQVVKNSYTELTNTALALAICWCTSSLQMSKARVYRSA